MHSSRLFALSIIFLISSSAHAAKDCPKQFDSLDRQQMNQADGDDFDAPQMGDGSVSDEPFSLSGTVDGDDFVVAAPAKPMAPPAPKIEPKVTVVETPKPVYKSARDLQYAFYGDKPFQGALNKLMKFGGQEAEEDLLLIGNRDNFAEIKDKIIALPPSESRKEIQAIRSRISEEAFSANAASASAEAPEKILADRVAERSSFVNYPGYLRRADEDVIAVRRAFPMLGKNIDDATTKIKALKLKDQSFDGLLKENDVTKDAKLVTRLSSELDAPVKAAIEKVWARLNDPEAFGNYVRALAEDAAVAMSKSKSARKQDALKRGELTRSAVMEILVKRHRASGNDAFAVIVGRQAKPKPSTATRKTGSNDDFRAAVGQGPFFDKPFDGVRHGIDTHFLQIEYVADAVWEATGGQPRLFWDYLGSKKGIRLWVPLFDNFSSSPTFTSPEYTAHQVSGILKITN